jgi:2-amino-4-hydroxy-6-hydroxymethyldihydropteridine diphosphokinase
MSEVGFSLGGNVGDRVATVTRALDRLFATPGLGFRAASSFYETPPWGYEDQAPFVNVCAVGETGLAPRRILDACKSVEAELGREQTFRWGPRVIDVDVLYYDGAEILEPDLAIPHRELFNRAFVLRPLAEIRPDLVLAGRRIADEARRFTDEPIAVLAAPWTPGR